MISVVAAALAGTLVLAPSPALAQTGKAGAESAKDQARQLADEGGRLLDKGDYRGAIQKLEQAHAKFAAPTIEIALAEAHEKLGELRAAREIYQRVAAEKIESGAPAEFKEAQEGAEKAVRRLDKAIPKVFFVLVGKAPPVLSIALDGTTLEGDIWGEPMPLDPGDHTLLIEMTGRDAETRTIALGEGETRRIEIRAGAEKSPAPPPPAPEPKRSFAAPAVAFGTGAAGLVAGSIAGGLALSKMGNFQEACGPRLSCPESMKGDLSSARIAGHVSTVGFAVAGAGAALGTVLLLLPAGGNKAAPSVNVGVSPFGLVATGRF